MIKFFTVMLLVISLSQCDAECIRKRWTMDCSSFEDFYDPLQDLSTWASVNIHSKEKQKINATILTPVPNIQYIKFKSSVNNISDFTFAAPSNLIYIEFDSCDIPIIRENSFVINSVKDVNLFIWNSKVNYLEPNCFAKSINLYEIKLNGNNITKININVFNGTSIARLNLINNNIKIIEENALSNMPRLRRLNLDRNFLTSFDAKLYLHNVPTLSFLFLSGNKIEFLNKNNFIFFPELTYLYLDSNKIQGIENDAFHGLTKLEILNIANNSLYSLLESYFPYNGLPSLTILDISNNRLNYFPKLFSLWFPKLTEISIFENPWQCACYNDIMKAFSYTSVRINCANDYLNGQRPVCIVPRTGDNKCNRNIPDPNELYKTFTEGLKEYDALEHCKVEYH